MNLQLAESAAARSCLHDDPRRALFDIDELIAACRTAVTEDEPRLAVKEVLARTVHDAEGVADVLRPSRAGITPLYSGEDVSVLHVVWAPGMRFRPLYLMWAAIALYRGQEDSTFYRRVGVARSPRRAAASCGG